MANILLYIFKIQATAKKQN